MKKIFALTIALTTSILLFSQEIDVSVDGIPSIKQPSTMSCWAASYTMLYSWKKSLSIEIEDAIEKVPNSNKFKKIFNDNTGISEEEELDFYSKAGLTVIKQFNPSIQGWGSLLESNGPLSITVDANPPKGTIHALVIVGIKGDGSTSGTKIIYIDPADGNKYSESFKKFITLYEGSENWSNQIIHY